MLQGRGCAQIAGNFKGFPKLINFLFFELFEIEKIGFEWQCVFIEPSGSWQAFQPLSQRNSHQTAQPSVRVEK